MIDARLSRDIEVGAIGRPRYATDVIQMESGSEFRVPRWRYPLFTFEFNIEPGDPASSAGDTAATQSLEEFIELWHAAGGQAETFRFRHWADYRGRDQLIAYGDGSTTEFQLYRVYTAGAVTRQRKITRPVDGTLTAYVDGVEASATMDPDTGLITFAVAPASLSEITVDFDFDVPVRFGSDELELVALTKDLDQPLNIELVEVRERSA